MFNGMYNTTDMPMGNIGWSYPYVPQQSSGIQGITFVDGFEGARSCMVPAGRKALLMDKNTQTFYVKSVDYSGVATMKVYEFREVPKEAEQQTQYVTRQEFEELKALLNGGNNESTVQSNKSDDWPTSA